MLTRLIHRRVNTRFAYIDLVSGIASLGRYMGEYLKYHDVYTVINVYSLKDVNNIHERTYDK